MGIKILSAQVHNNKEVAVILFGTSRKVVSRQVAEKWLEKLGYHFNKDISTLWQEWVKA